MKDNRDKKLTDLLVDLAIQYYMAFQAAPNTHRTLRQLHDNFMQNEKKKGDESGFPAASYSPLQLMELAVERRDLGKEQSGNILWRLMAVFAIACVVLTAYAIMSPASETWGWILLWSTALTVAACSLLGARDFGHIATYEIILTRHAETLYDFVEALQALGTKFGPFSKFCFLDSRKFADYKYMQDIANRQLIECALWVRVSSREGDEGGSGSPQKHEAERMLALAHAALARINLSTADFAPYYEKADKEIKKHEEGTVAGVFGSTAPAVFTMKKPDVPLLG